MPFYKTITAPNHTKILIWKIEESMNALAEGILLTENCKLRLAGMKSELHQRGFLSIRQLLKIAGYSPNHLFYDAFGKPHLTDGKKISITHSFTFSAIIISDVEVGIDIEMQRKKISLIAHKFIGYEFNYLTEEDVRRLTVVWCCKESLYKVFATEGLSFKQHCKIVPFQLKDAHTTGWVHFLHRVEKYNMFFFELEGFTCAYALKT